MKKLVYLLIVILATGCVSKLKVVVEVADRDKVIAETNKLDKPNIVFSIMSLDKFLNNWETQHKSKMGKLYEDVQKSLNVTSLSPDVVRAFENKINAFVENIRDNKTTANQYYTSFIADKNNDNFVAAKYYIEKAGENILQLEKALEEAEILSVTALNSKPESQKVAVTISESKTALATNGTLRTRFPILGDELAWFISKNKDKDIWKSVFNKTVCSNIMGNADMAMILRSNPPENEIKSGDYNNNFTIKGVRLDAADATNALFTGLTQTFNFIAATQGIPAILNATPQTGTTENPLPQTTAVNTIYDDQYKIESDRKKYTYCKQLLAQKIKQENILALSDETAVKDAAKRIREYWETIIKVELQKP